MTPFISQKQKRLSFLSILKCVKIKNKQIKNLIFITIVLIGFACISKENKNSSDNFQLVSPDTCISELNHSESVSEINNYLKVNGDSIEIPPFEIQLILSDSAEKKLKKEGETIIISVWFEGVPIESIPRKYLDEDGILTLLSYELEITDKRILRFDNLRFSKELFDFLKNKDILLLINIFSGRRSTDVNLLDCDILQGYMSKIKYKRFILNGKLIRE